MSKKNRRFRFAYDANHPDNDLELMAGDNVRARYNIYLGEDDEVLVPRGAGGQIIEDEGGYWLVDFGQYGEWAIQDKDLDIFAEDN